MTTQSELENAILEKLSTVIDPETGVDVVRMRLVQDICFVSPDQITYTFRPSSPLCPLAATLALDILQAIAEVPGISAQRVTVVDYIQADQLTEMLNSIYGPSEKKNSN